VVLDHLGGVIDGLLVVGLCVQAGPVGVVQVQDGLLQALRSLLLRIELLLYLLGLLPEQAQRLGSKFLLELRVGQGALVPVEAVCQFLGGLTRLLDLGGQLRHRGGSQVGLAALHQLGQGVVDSVDVLLGVIPRVRLLVSQGEDRVHGVVEVVHLGPATAEAVDGAVELVEVAAEGHGRLA
jgi:hypothetical protein